MNVAITTSSSACSIISTRPVDIVCTGPEADEWRY